MGKMNFSEDFKRDAVVQITGRGWLKDPLSKRAQQDQSQTEL